MSRGAATAYMHIPYVVWPWARSSQHISLVSSECHSLACAAPNPGALCTRGGARGSHSSLRFTQPLYVYSSSRHPQKDSRATTYTHTQGGPSPMHCAYFHELSRYWLIKVVTPSQK